MEKKLAVAGGPEAGSKELGRDDKGGRVGTPVGEEKGERCKRSRCERIGQLRGDRAPWVPWARHTRNGTLQELQGRMKGKTGARTVENHESVHVGLEQRIVVARNDGHPQRHHEEAAHADPPAADIVDGSHGEPVAGDGGA